MDFTEVEKAFRELREKSPVVVQITNFVSAEFQADCTLFIGAHPVMPVSFKEVKEILFVANSLLVNTGNLTDERMLAIKEALRVAGERGLPVVLDPVGCNVSSFRRDFVLDILENYRIDVIKGNAAEISAIVGEHLSFKAIETTKDMTDDRIAPMLEKISNKYDCVVVSTGKVDFVALSSDMILITGGTPFLKWVSGIGCCIGSIVASLLTIREPFEASVLSLQAVKVISVRAAVGMDAPGDFKSRFLNELYLLGG